MARLKTRWNLDKDARTHSEIASVISTNIWRIITGSLLDMENEGFATVSNSQRLDILAEFAAYAIHLLDRYIYNDPSLVKDRQRIVSQTARHLGGIIRDNRHDTKNAMQGKASFTTLLNKRADEYSECKYDGEPDFHMQRMLGEYVSEAMDKKNRKWVATYILDIEAHRIYSSLSKVLDNFLVCSKPYTI